MKSISHILLVPATGIHNGNSWGGKQVHPSAAHGDIERRTVLHYRSFKLYPALQKSKRKTTMIFLHVSVVSTYINHRREPSAITGRKTTFIKIYILDNVCIESRKQPSGMVYLIQGSTIQKKQILIIVSTMYVQSGDKLRPAGHSRQALKFLYHIGRAHKVVSIYKVLRCKRDFSCLSSMKRRVQISRHHHFIELVIRLQSYIL